MSKHMIHMKSPNGKISIACCPIESGRSTTWQFTCYRVDRPAHDGFEVARLWAAGAAIVCHGRTFNTKGNARDYAWGHMKDHIDCGHDRLHPPMVRGSVERNNIAGMTKAQLVALASDKGLTTTTKMTKATLIDLIAESDG